MDWIVRLLPGRQVTTRSAASGCRNIQAVVVVHMAGRARNVRMAVSEREAKGVVIEFSVGPSRDRVTSGAGTRGGRKACLDVVWNIAANRRSAIPIRLVTAHAVR